MCMTTLSQAKTMGGVGSILVLLVPFLALTSFATPTIIFSGLIVVINVILGLVGLVGVVLILVAVKQISDAVNDREIFNNVLMAVIIQIVGGVIVAFAAIVIGGLSAIFAVQDMRFGDVFTILRVAVFPILSVLVVALIGTWIVLIVSAWFLRKGYELIAAKTGTEIFRKVGRWYYYGAWLVIVLVGFIISFIASILQVVAFFSLPESPPAQPTPQQPSGVQPL
jgi:uncharacterized membrane protein